MLMATLGLYKINNANNCHINNKLIFLNYNYTKEIPLLTNRDYKYENLLSNKEIKLHSLSNIEITNIKGNEINEINWYSKTFKNIINTFLIIIIILSTCLIIHHLPI